MAHLLITLAVILGLIIMGFFAFRLHGVLRPKPMAMSLEQFFLGNPIRLKFFGPRQALALVGDLGGQQVAEVGTGIGIMVVALAHRVGPSGHVWGVDIQEDAVRRSTARLKRHGMLERASIVQATADNLPWSSGQLDAVIMVAVLGEVPRPLRTTALTEIRRVLNPQHGRLFLTEFWPDPHYLPPKVLETMAADAGFIVEEIKHFPMIYTMKLVPVANP